MSVQIQVERARDSVAVDRTGSTFPLLIFSPANQGDPHNYAFTMERFGQPR